MKLTIRGETWQVNLVRMPRSDHGACYRDERVIELNTGMSRTMTIRTVIHEVVHAVRWDLAERDVEDIADASTKILVKLDKLGLL